MKKQTMIAVLSIILIFVFVAGCLAKTTSLENANIALAKKAITDLFSNRNTDLADEILDASFVRHDNENLTEPAGPQGIKNSIQWNAEHVPDYKVTITDVFASENKVAAHWTYSGTSKTFNRKFSVDGISIFHCKNGKIIAEWRMYNREYISTQLGFTLTPPDIKE